MDRILKNGVFLLLITVTIVACEIKQKEDRLPILGYRDVVEKEIDGKKVIDTAYHTIPEFSLVNQDSNVVTNKTLSDKIYVADFFFTSCPSICPIMKTQMLRVYEEFKDDNSFAIVSHSIDPEYDTVALLKDYAERLGVDNSQKWMFLTGDRDEIFELGEKGYIVTTKEDEEAPGGYLHSGAFILVDKERRIRGLYDGTKADRVDQLMIDIVKLKEEYQTPDAK
ncbi:SCO family protein [Fulvivirgaceae bacterium BMA10]|uniref:SCO family protein n=1 Tax=Splendidivirga corallicola TaxID=3051826 RepID=A0ABT8KTL3_9BACT|nr:SCO family protein [Fulvivirgaceae bacterium BMA10]